MMEMERVLTAANEAYDEANAATMRCGPLLNAHHGLGVIEEEYTELKAHIFTKQADRDLAAMRAEAIQLAAMAICFAAQLCDEERGRL